MHTPVQLKNVVSIPVPAIHCPHIPSLYPSIISTTVADLTKSSNCPHSYPSECPTGIPTVDNELPKLPKLSTLPNCHITEIQASLHRSIRTQKNRKTFIFRFLLRRGRDSNPRILSDQRFSRPPQSTTLPPLQYHCFRFGIANVRIIFTIANFYCIFLQKKEEPLKKSLQK